MCFLDNDNGEAFKWRYHGLLEVLAAGACCYNAAAFVTRRETHLAVNALVYFALTCLEHQHVQHHRART